MKDKTKKRIKNLKKVIKLPSFFISRLKITEDKVKDAIMAAPRITNETVTEHREEVLGSARKYIYPLRHPKHHFIRISLGLLVAVVIAFFIYTALELYDFQSTSGFIYSATEVIPFPVAKVGSSWVSYYSYLFELRRNIHYYETQQQADFSSKSGKDQLTSLREQAMDQVVENAYVKQLASKNHVSVSSTEVNQEVALVREQNRLGNSTEVFNNVLKEYWGWTEGDFKQELSQELLQQKVVVKLDTQVDSEAESIRQQLLGGASFASEAELYSQDTSTKSNGGQYSSAITVNSDNVAPQIVAEVLKLKPGVVSPIINTGYTLDILEDTSVSGGSVQAEDIQLNFNPISVYTNPLRAQHPPKEYIKF